MKYRYPEYQKKWRIENKERMKLLQEEWRKNNHEKCLEYNRKSRSKFDKTPKGVFLYLRKNAKKRGIEVKMTREEFIDWYLKQKKVCHYCDIPENKLFLFDNHFPKKGAYGCNRLQIDRIKNSSPYSIKNIVLACAYCNSVKSNLFSEKEMKSIAKKFIKPKWKI